MFYGGKATEPPFSGKLLHLTAMGDYSCAGCSSVYSTPAPNLTLAAAGLV